MKYSALKFGGLLFLMLALAACGGTSGMGDMQISSPTPAATMGTASTGSMTTVQVTETEYSITSSLTSFMPGIAYHFVVTNTGQTAHEFMIMPKSEGTMGNMSMGEMDTMALAMIETIAPGETKTVNYTFPSSTAGSSPEFAYYVAGHYETGMKLGVTVMK